jgi:hypothetical protein
MILTPIYHRDKFTPSQPAPNQGPAAKGQETRRSLTAQDPRHRLPRVSAGKREQQIADATPALELAVLTRCEYAKSRKPAGKASITKCVTPARDMNRAMRVVER